MRYSILLFMVLAYSCENKCKEDTTFEEAFFKNISLVEEYYHYQDSINELILQNKPYDYNKFDGYGDKIWNAICYSSVVTGIDFGQYPYNNVDSIVALWEEWYEQNKCHMTMNKADSIYFYDCEAFSRALDLFSLKGDLSDEEYFDFLLDSIRKVGR